jgi:putative nucleotidyltransferase with HDIG domain
MSRNQFLRAVAPAFTLADAGAFGMQVGATSLISALALLDRLECHRPSCAAHSLRVSRLAMAMWRVAPAWLGPVETVLVGSLLHDIGKLYVPNEILGAERGLTAAERVVVNAHAPRGAALLAGLGFPPPVVAVARDHHERWAGGGYPTGQPAHRLAPVTRAVAAADAFIAMVEPGRGYRPARSTEAALAELTAGSGTQFDPEAVAILADCISGWRSQAPDIGSLDIAPTEPLAPDAARYMALAAGDARPGRRRRRASGSLRSADADALLPAVAWR